MRRMVVVLREESPAKRAFSPGPMAPEKRFADLMADRAAAHIVSSSVRLNLIE